MREPEVDALARVMMAAWEQAEHAPVSASFVATHADMARAVIKALPRMLREDSEIGEVLRERLGLDLGTTDGMVDEYGFLPNAAEPDARQTYLFDRRPRVEQLHALDAQRSDWSRP